METKSQEQINEEILNSHKFIKNGIEYPNPSFYLTPVIKLFTEQNKKGQLIIQGDIADQVGDKTSNDKIYTSYNRVSLIKTFDIDEEINYQIGFVYALDLGKPIIKVFSGVNVKDCTNLCIFGADKKQEFLIANNSEGATLHVQKYIETLTNDIKQAKQIIHDMKNTFFNTREVEKMLGDFLLGFSATKNVAGTQCLLNAANLLTSKESMYYFENLTNAWNIYNSLTHQICNKKHILQQPEKVYTLWNEMKKHKEFASETLHAKLN